METSEERIHPDRLERILMCFKDNKILEKIAPVLVRKYKRSQAPALTPKEVAILLEERNRFPSTLAQQAVQMWYDHV